MRMSGDCTRCGRHVEYDVTLGVCFDSWGNCRCPGRKGDPLVVPSRAGGTLSVREAKMPYHDLSTKESAEKSRYGGDSPEHNLVEVSLPAPECLGEVS